MIISAATHPHYRVRDDRGDEVRDVIRIDTEAMTILTLVRDRAGAAVRDGGGIVTQERRLLAAIRDVQPCRAVDAEIHRRVGRARSATSAACGWWPILGTVTCRCR